ncbi:MAG: hydroxydechloroatrazine ethylaminohydrolase [Desulfuromonas sp. SDB]|nr:MAG: hydroxydechloroatrazine ethylaminohydrolase [Desulfuromonas sp. SDB]
MILLKNCKYIATFNDREDELEHYDILIKDNKIEEIFKNIKLTTCEEKNTQIVDCSHHLVVPGLINTHHHFYQILTRNLPSVQNVKLFQWLKRLYPIWSHLNEKQIFYSTIAACAELVKTGCTTTSDHMYLYPKDFTGDITAVQFEGARQVGIRFSPCRGAMTFGQAEGGLPPENVVQSPQQVIKDMQRVVEMFHDSDPFSMSRIILAPCSPFSVEESIMIESAKLARQHKIVLHTHLGETEDENQFCLEKYGQRPLQIMEKWNWLGEDVYYAHGIWFNQDELDLLSTTSTGIAHCPSSNMRLGSGVAKVKEMLSRKIRVGLGVDGSSSNDSSDMLGEARLALLLQRVILGADAITAREVLSMATRGGASLLGYSKIGSIQPGFAADLAVFNLHQLQHAGALSDPLAALLFTGFCHQTEHTIINGNFVVKHGMLTNLDEQQLVGKVNHLAHQLLQSAVQSQ